MKARAAFFLCAALALAACGAPDEPRLHGYAEGEYVMLAPETPGRIAAVLAEEGARAEAGAVLFRLDDRAERAALEAAEARAEAAAARFDDAAAGGREPEIAAARQTLVQARAVQTQTAEDLARARELFERGVVPRSRLDAAEAAAASANARVAELRERVTLAELPAREGQMRALAAEAGAAEAQAEAARDALARRTVTAPADGMVERVVRYSGETAGPTAPAIRYLPDGAVIAVLFIPQNDLAATPAGTRLAIACDGCPPDLAATIARISSQAEFTPPIIYSDAERARLVFRAEARFEGAPPPPGTPLRAERRR